MRRRNNCAANERPLGGAPSRLALQGLLTRFNHRTWPDLIALRFQGVFGQACWAVRGMLPGHETDLRPSAFKSPSLVPFYSLLLY